MGNCISCSSILPTKPARVIFPGGEIRQYNEPLKATEIMMESPNFFLVNYKSLNICRRFVPLSADEDVEFGKVYIMVPMRRVNSIITAADMAVVLIAVNSASKRITTGSVKVLLEVVAAAMGMDFRSPESEVGRSRFRSASYRSRKPGLDTIIEEPAT